MNISPIDLRKYEFRNAFRGYDKVEVTSLLLAVADDYERALRETDRLRQDLVRVEAIVNEHREQERSLKSTLMAAQRLADDIKANAEQEAHRVVRDAQSRSDLILEKERARLEDLQRDIDGMRLRRRDVETTLEATIQALGHTLEYVREQDAHEREDKILLHRPKSSQEGRSAEPPDAETERHAAGGQ